MAKKKKCFFLHIYFEIQSTLNIVRDGIVQLGFMIVKSLYHPLKKGETWTINSKRLLRYAPQSLGFHTGCFLLKNHFELQPKCEEHDIHHVLTQFSTDTHQEIGMQFWLLGNGKKSLPTLLAAGAGLILYLDQLRFFNQAYLLGKMAQPIHNIDFRDYLDQPVEHLQNLFNIQNSIF